MIPSDIVEVVRDEFKDSGIDYRLALAIAWHESSFKPKAVNKTGGDGKRGGSYGIFQMSLLTARALGFKGTETELYDIKVNTILALKLLLDIKKRQTDIEDILACYNSGKPFAKAPKSTTIKYVPSILAKYQKIIDGGYK